MIKISVCRSPASCTKSQSLANGAKCSKKSGGRVSRLSRCRCTEEGGDGTGRIGIHQCAARPLQRYGGCEWQLGAGYACGEDRPGNRDCDPGERAVAEVAYRNAHTLCFASSIQFSSRVALAMLPCSSQLSWDLRVYDTISRWS